MINEQIRDKEIRLIGENGEQLGIMSAREAMKLAEEAELDLVKIAPTAKPPVCKIIDYGKYRYELARKEKEAKKKQKVVELKEIRLSPNIDLNDLNTKMNAAKKFLSKGDKVKITLRFRGREMAHMNAYLTQQQWKKHQKLKEEVSAWCWQKRNNYFKEESIMPKMKTSRAAAKRFKVTGTGKLKRSKAYKRHILTKKTTKTKRNLRKPAMTDATNVKNMKKILPYL